MIIREFKTESVLTKLAKRYQDWHTPGRSGSRKKRIGQPGSGREFLQFHRSLLDSFFAWNAIHPVAQRRDITAWTAVPAELKVPQTGWPHPWQGLDLALAEIRLNKNLPPFANEDELGIFIETTIVDWLHSAVAAAPAFDLSAAERAIITDPLRALESTWFYKIYGLSQYWWSRFLHPGPSVKEHHDVRGFGKDVNDYKEANDARGSGGVFEPFGKEANDYKQANDARGFGKEANDYKQASDSQGFGKDVNDYKEANDARGSGGGVFQPLGKDNIDFKESNDSRIAGGGFKDVADNLLARIRDLEARLKTKKSPFIKPFQRPPVGRSTIRSKKKRDR